MNELLFIHRIKIKKNSRKETREKKNSLKWEVKDETCTVCSVYYVFVYVANYSQKNVIKYCERKNIFSMSLSVFGISVMYMQTLKFLIPSAYKLRERSLKTIKIRRCVCIHNAQSMKISHKFK